MKIFPISDIHTDIWRPRQNYWSTHFKFLKDIDVMVIAGDLGSATNNMVTLSQILLEHPHLDIVYVLGNHDYYGTVYSHAYDSMLWADYQLDRLHVLTGDDMSSWEKDNVVFIGGTLWTDFNKEHAFTMNEVQRYLNDYRAIFSGDGTIKPRFILDRHYNMRKQIFKALERDKYKDKTRIVVTHHQPFLPDCITEATTYGYCVDLEDWFNNCERLPEYWISGHTHKSHWKVKQYTHGEVTFVSNQFGYPSEEPTKTGYRNDCILEV